MGFEVLNVTTDLSELGFPDAQRDIAGGGDPIQHAIDEFIANPEKYFAIWIPPGVYKTSRSLIVGADGRYVRVAMIGAPASFPTGSALGGTILEFHGGGGEVVTDNHKLQPALIVQGSRACYFQGIHFVSKGNTAPRDIHVPSHSEIFAHDAEEWISPGVRTNASSPQCVVAVDPFIPAFPGGDENNRYPGLEEYYGELWKKPWASSAMTFVSCGFEGGYVGVAVSPPGASPSEVDSPQSVHKDLLSNAENFIFDGCFWNYNYIHYSIGQSQARANELRSPRMFGSWIAIDSEHIGPGGNSGQHPILTGAERLA